LWWRTEEVDAGTSIDLLRKILAENPGQGRIRVILDNARYHKAKLVQHWLAAEGQC